MQLSDATLRLFPFYDIDVLQSLRARQFVAVRLLEDGDSADLRALFAALGEDEIRAHFATCGGRQLSRRSRAFWSLVLESRPQGNPCGGELWPL